MEIDLKIFNNKNEIINPVFEADAWETNRMESIRMKSYFELNKYTKLDSFNLTAEYPIDNLGFFKLKFSNDYIINGQTFLANKQYEVKILNKISREKLIE